MSVRGLAFVIILNLALIANSTAQEYELGWDQVSDSPTQASTGYNLGWQSVDHQVVRAQAHRVVPERSTVVTTQSSALVHQAPIAEYRPVAAQPVFKREENYGSVWAKKASPTYNIEFSTMQFYNAYKEKYLKVQLVEVAVYRKGSFTCDVYENLAECNEFEVFLNDLKDGDSYSVRVVWSDGSNRTIENTIDSFADRNVLVDRPDCLAYNASW